jgi:murein L,D-transpeptidase YcbB/YkuD
VWLAASTTAAGDDPVWFDGGRPNARAREAVELLAGASSHGLDPRDYAADSLRQTLVRHGTGPVADATAMALMDDRLRAALRRYLNDLHRGRIDPGHLQSSFSRTHRDGFDADAALQAALATGALDDAVRAAVPAVPQYERLRAMLARYRALADDPAWRRPLPRLPDVGDGRSAKLEPGQPYAGLQQLARRLELLGDLPSAAAAPASVYGGVLVDAVKAFQQRHGLDDDGVIGAATLARLQVSPAARAHQIELMLERLRWTPALQGSRVVAINIPEFVLRAYEVRDGRIGVLLAMKVIVGKALEMPTPLFDADLRFIEFSPYWNVPPSIARHEVVPQLKRHPDHWIRDGYEFVAADGRVDTGYSITGLDAVLAGGQRIRQRPGPRNPLGDIKFVLPNHEQIYLHHTPSTALFERERRDFSHGCIRVERPVELAQFVLHGMPQWTEERIRQAMDRGESATLRVAEPVRVLIAYGTALVKDGRMHFFDDIYGLDRLLDDALKRRASERLRSSEARP